MRLRDLPGYPPEYVDLAELGPRTPDSLRLHASKTAEADVRRDALAAVFAHQAEDVRLGPDAHRNLALLAQPGTLLIGTNVQPALFGGTLSQLLACLTAIRLVQDLSREGYAAVPVVWVDAGTAAATGIHVVDSEGRIVALSAPLTTDGAISPPIDRLTDELAAIYSLKQSSPDSLKLLVESYSPGVGLALATRRLLAGLLEPWGALVVDRPEPGLVRAAAVARVVGPGSVPPLSTGNLAGEPLLWPSVNMTLVDARSRKIMDRYGLVLLDLFAGKDALLGRVEGGLGEERALERFGQAGVDVDSSLAELAALVPPGDSLHKAIGEARGKMKYQLEKVRERYCAAVSARRDIAARQLERLCNTLAPGGRPQELRLAAVHFLLRYSRAVLTEIVDKMDAYNSEHQQIALE